MGINESDGLHHGWPLSSFLDRLQVLAFGQIRDAIVVTDDLGMHKLAQDFGIDIWHGHELLKKMLTAKLITNEQVKSIFEALELNGDFTETWRQAKHTIFLKLFGRG